MLKANRKLKKNTSGVKGMIVAIAALSVVIVALVTLIILDANGVFDKPPEKIRIEPPKTVGDFLTDGDYDYILLEGGGVMLVMFNGEPTEVINIPSTLGGYPVYAIGELSYALIDEIIKEVHVPEGVTYIGKGAFSGIENARLYLPSTINQIADMALYGFEDPSGIYYAGSREDWKKVKVGSENKVLANIIFEK